MQDCEVAQNVGLVDIDIGTVLEPYEEPYEGPYEEPVVKDIAENNTNFYAWI